MQLFRFLRELGLEVRLALPGIREHLLTVHGMDLTIGMTLPGLVLDFGA